MVIQGKLKLTKPLKRTKISSNKNARKDMYVKLRALLIGLREESICTLSEELALPRKQKKIVKLLLELQILETA